MLAGASKGTILIVDDRQENLHLLSDIFIEQGYKVRAVISGPMALRSIQLEPPDILLLDVNMPDMNGYEVCQRVKSDERTQHIPVIFISALGEVMNKVEAFQSGGIDYITKPFQVEEVLARVNTHLTLQRMQQQLQEQNTALQQEINERQRTEEDLQRANQRLTGLVEELEQYNREMMLLNQLGNFLQRSQSLEEGVANTLPLMQQLFPDQEGRLYILNHQTSVLELVMHWGKTEPTPAFAPEQCHAFEGGRMHHVESAQDTMQCEHTEGEDPYPYICVQLATRGEIFGLLHIQHGPREPLEVCDRWQRLCMMVADRLALSLMNIQLRDELREQSVRDPLTNLYNRRYLSEMLNRDLSRAQRYQYPIGFILFDLDRFKHYNDTYGHAVGDAILSAIGKTVLNSIRSEDIACRYGGEEFLLVLPGATVPDTSKRAETLCQHVREMSVLYDDQVFTSIRASFGVAGFPEHGMAVEEIIKAADTALYHAKEHGRNQVVTAELTTRESPLL